MTALVLSMILSHPGDTPEATIQAFVTALNSGDLRAAARQVDGKTRTDFPFQKGKASMKATMGAVKIDCDDAQVEVDLTFDGARRKEAAHDTVHLRHTAGDWRIVPAYPKTNPGWVPTLPTLAMIVSDDPKMAQARDAAKNGIAQTQSLVNVKQLALATLMYAQDHGDRLPSVAGFRTAITPYLRDKNVFTAPGEPKGSVSYFLDPRVSGKAFSTIPAPAETAMIIQGTPQKTVFPYRGRTPLGFVDGHVKVSYPAEVLKARKAALQ